MNTTDPKSESPNERISGELDDKALEQITGGLTRLNRTSSPTGLVSGPTLLSGNQFDAASRLASTVS
jgi:bacteriocin-like protein